MSDARSNNYTFRMKKPFKVLVCLVTLVAFSVNTISYDLALLRPFGFVGHAWAVNETAGLTSVGPERSGGPGSPKELRVDTFMLPAYLGTVQYAWGDPAPRLGQESGNGLARGGYESLPPVVIHIQDAHCNYPAQKKIAEIVGYLNREYGIKTVNLEGGAKDYDLRVFTGIDDLAVREKVSDHFVGEGTVSGAEYYAINNPDKVDLWGVEDPKLYVRNLNVYRDSLKHKDEIDKDIKALSHILSNLKTKIYPKPLLEFDLRYTQYKANNLPFREYLAYLVLKAKDSGIAIKSFTNIYLLSQALDEEESIDFKQANNERDALIDVLNKKLSKKSMEELVVNTVEFKADRMSYKQFYTYLTGKAKAVGIDLTAYPVLEKYVIYVSMYEAIDKARIMAELEVLEDGIRGSLSENDEQRELAALSKNLALLKNFFNISITRSDYAYYKRDADGFAMSRFTEFINRTAPLYKIDARPDKDISNIDKYRRQMAQFYEYSFMRDGAFVKNIKFSDAPGQAKGRKATVVITGGFHTENLCDLFKEKGVSYISVLPNFKNKDGYESRYYALLQGKEDPVEKQIIAILPSALAIASYLNSIGTLTRGAKAEAAFNIRVRWAAAIANGKSGILVKYVKDGKILELAIGPDWTIVPADTPNLQAVNLTELTSALQLAPPAMQVPSAVATKPATPDAGIPRPTIDRRIDMVKADAWVNAHPPELRDMARAIIENITYIDQGQFEEALKETTRDFNSKFKGRYAAVIPRGFFKSNYWAMKIAENDGMRPAEGVADTDTVQQWLVDHPDIDDILLIDDASYSGDQLASSIEFIRDAVASEPALRNRNIRVHISVPYLTGLAFERIRSVSGIEINVYRHRGIRTVDDIFKELIEKDRRNLSLYEQAKKIYANSGTDKVTLTYFQHKMPDFVSTLTLYLNDKDKFDPVGIMDGAVADSKGRIIAVIPFIPKIDSPYKVNRYGPMAAASTAAPAQVTPEVGEAGPAALTLPGTEKLLVYVFGKARWDRSADWAKKTWISLVELLPSMLFNKFINWHGGTAPDKLQRQKGLYGVIYPAMAIAAGIAGLIFFNDPNFWVAVLSTASLANIVSHTAYNIWAEKNRRAQLTLPAPMIISIEDKLRGISGINAKMEKLGAENPELWKYILSFDPYDMDKSHDSILEFAAHARKISDIMFPEKARNYKKEMHVLAQNGTRYRATTVSDAGETVKVFIKDSVEKIGPANAQDDSAMLQNSRNAWYQCREYAMMKMLQAENAKLGENDRTSMVNAVDAYSEVDTGGARHLCIVTEYIEGGTLRDLMGKLKITGHKLSLDEVKLIGEKLLENVVKMRRLKVMHLDLHPGNIYIKYDEASGKVNDVVVGDFGLSIHDPDGKFASVAAWRGSPDHSPRDAINLVSFEDQDGYSIGRILYDLLFMDVPGWAAVTMDDTKFKQLIAGYINSIKRGQGSANNGVSGRIEEKVVQNEILQYLAARDDLFSRFYEYDNDYLHIIARLLMVHKDPKTGKADKYNPNSALEDMRSVDIGNSSALIQAMRDGLMQPPKSDASGKATGLLLSELIALHSEGEMFTDEDIRFVGRGILRFLKGVHDNNRSCSLTAKNILLVFNEKGQKDIRIAGINGLNEPLTGNLLKKDMETAGNILRTLINLAPEKDREKYSGNTKNVVEGLQSGSFVDAQAALNLLRPRPVLSAPGSLFGMEGALTKAPWIEEGLRTAFAMIGGIPFAIFNTIFVLLHWNRYRFEFIQQYEDTHNGRSPPEWRVFIHTTLTAGLTTLTSLATLQLLAISPILYFAINAMVHLGLNYLAVNGSITPANLTGIVDPRIIDMLKAKFGDNFKALDPFAKFNLGIPAIQLMKTDFGFIKPNPDFIKINGIGNIRNDDAMLDRLVADFVRLLGLKDAPKDFSDGLKALLRDRYFESIKDLKEFDGVILEEYAAEVKTLIQNTRIKHEIVTTPEERERIESRIKPILVRMARWGINLGLVDINSVKGSPKIDHAPVIAISTKALAGFGDVTKTRQIVPGIVQELRKKGITEFKIKVLVLKDDEEKFRKVNIAGEFTGDEYKGKVEFVFTGKNILPIGDPDIRNIDVMLVLVRPVSEVIEMPSTEIDRADIPEVSFTLGEYDSQVSPNPRLRSSAQFEIGTGFGERSIGFFVNPDIEALRERVDSLSPEARVDERRSLMMNILADVMVDDYRKYTISEYARVHGREPQKEEMEDEVEKVKKGWMGDRELIGKAAELANASLPWGVLYMHRYGARYLEALDRYRSANGLKDKPVVVFTTLGDTNKEHKEDPNADEFRDMHEAALKNRTDARFYDLSRNQEELGRMDLKSPGIIVINLGVRPTLSGVRLRALSDLPAGMTGDESLLETLTLRKPVLYEVMSWKQRLFVNFLKRIGSLGEDTKGVWQPLLAFMIYHLSDEYIKALYSLPEGREPTREEVAFAADVKAFIEEVKLKEDDGIRMSGIFDISDKLKEVMQRIGEYVSSHGLYYDLVPMLLEYVQITKFFSAMMDRYPLDEEAAREMSPVTIFDIQKKIMDISPKEAVAFMAASNDYIMTSAASDLKGAIANFAAATKLKAKYEEITKSSIIQPGIDLNPFLPELKILIENPGADMSEYFKFYSDAGKGKPQIEGSMTIDPKILEKWFADKAIYDFKLEHIMIKKSPFILQVLKNIMSNIAVFIASLGAINLIDVWGAGIANIGALAVAGVGKITGFFSKLHGKVQGAPESAEEEIVAVYINGVVGHFEQNAPENDLIRQVIRELAAVGEKWNGAGKKIELTRRQMDVLTSAAKNDPDAARIIANAVVFSTISSAELGPGAPARRSLEPPHVGGAGGPTLITNWVRDLFPGLKNHRIILGIIAGILEVGLTPFVATFLAKMHGPGKVPLSRKVGLGLILGSSAAAFLLSAPLLGALTAHMPFILAAASPFLAAILANMAVHGIYNTLAVWTGWAPLTVAEKEGDIGKKIAVAPRKPVNMSGSAAGNTYLPITMGIMAVGAFAMVALAAGLIPALYLSLAMTTTALVVMGVYKLIKRDVKSKVLGSLFLLLAMLDFLVPLGPAFGNMPGRAHPQAPVIPVEPRSSPVASVISAPVSAAASSEQLSLEMAQAYKNWNIRNDKEWDAAVEELVAIALGENGVNIEKDAYRAKRRDAPLDTAVSHNYRDIWGTIRARYYLSVLSPSARRLFVKGRPIDGSITISDITQSDGQYSCTLRSDKVRGKFRGGVLISKGTSLYYPGNRPTGGMFKQIERTIRKDAKRFLMEDFSEDILKGPTYYHATNIKPWWANKMRKVMAVEDHAHKYYVLDGTPWFISLTRKIASHDGRGAPGAWFVTKDGLYERRLAWLETPVVMGLVAGAYFIMNLLGVPVEMYDRLFIGAGAGVLFWGGHLLGLAQNKEEALKRLRSPPVIVLTVGTIAASFILGSFSPPIGITAVIQLMVVHYLNNKYNVPASAVAPAGAALSGPSPMERFNKALAASSQDPMHERRKSWFADKLKDEGGLAVSDENGVIALAEILAHNANGRRLLLDLDNAEVADKNTCAKLKRWTKSRFCVYEDAGSGESVAIMPFSDFYGADNMSRFSDDMKAIACRVYGQWLKANNFSEGGTMSEAMGRFKVEVSDRYNIKLIIEDGIEKYGIRLIANDKIGPQMVDAVRDIINLLPVGMMSSESVRNGLAGGIKLNDPIRHKNSARIAQYVSEEQYLGVQPTGFTMSEFGEAFLHEFGHAISADYVKEFNAIVKESGADIYDIPALGDTGPARQKYLRYGSKNNELFAESFMHYVLHGKDMSEGFPGSAKNTEAWRRIYEFYRYEVFGRIEYRVIDGVLTAGSYSTASIPEAAAPVAPKPVPTPAVTLRIGELSAQQTGSGARGFEEALAECHEDPFCKNKQRRFAELLEEEARGAALFGGRAGVEELAGILATAANGRLDIWDIDTMAGVERFVIEGMKKAYGSRFAVSEDAGSGETMQRYSLGSYGLFTKSGREKFVDNDEKQEAICRAYTRWRNENRLAGPENPAEARSRFDKDITGQYGIPLVPGENIPAAKIEAARKLLLLIPGTMMSRKSTRQRLSVGIDLAAERVGGSRIAQYDPEKHTLGVQPAGFTARELIEAFMHELGHVFLDDHINEFEALCDKLSGEREIDIYSIPFLGQSGPVRRSYLGSIEDDREELFAETFAHYILQGEFMSSGFEGATSTPEAWRAIYSFYRDTVFGGIEYRLVNGRIATAQYKRAADAVPDNVYDNGFLKDKIVVRGNEDGSVGQQTLRVMRVSDTVEMGKRAKRDGNAVELEKAKRELELAVKALRAFDSAGPASQAGVVVVHNSSILSTANRLSDVLSYLNDPNMRESVYDFGIPYPDTYIAFSARGNRGGAAFDEAEGIVDVVRDRGKGVARFIMWEINPANRDRSREVGFGGKVFAPAISSRGAIGRRYEGVGHQLMLYAVNRELKDTGSVQFELPGARSEVMKALGLGDMPGDGVIDPKEIDSYVFDRQKLEPHIRAKSQWLVDKLRADARSGDTGATDILAAMGEAFAAKSPDGGFTAAPAAWSLVSGAATVCKGIAVNDASIADVNRKVKENSWKLSVGKKTVYVDKELSSKLESAMGTPTSMILGDLALFLTELFRTTPPAADEVVIALVESSRHLFEDYLTNGFIGVNSQLFTEGLSGSAVKDLLYRELKYELMREALAGERWVLIRNTGRTASEVEAMKKEYIIRLVEEAGLRGVAENRMRETCLSGPPLNPDDLAILDRLLVSNPLRRLKPAAEGVESVLGMLKRYDYVTVTIKPESGFPVRSFFADAPNRLKGVFIETKDSKCYVWVKEQTSEIVKPVVVPVNMISSISVERDAELNRRPQYSGQDLHAHGTDAYSLLRAVSNLNSQLRPSGELPDVSLSGERVKRGMSEAGWNFVSAFDLQSSSSDLSKAWGRYAAGAAGPGRVTVGNEELSSIPVCVIGEGVAEGDGGNTSLKNVSVFKRLNIRAVGVEAKYIGRVRELLREAGAKDIAVVEKSELEALVKEHATVRAKPDTRHASTGMTMLIESAYQVPPVSPAAPPASDPMEARSANIYRISEILESRNDGVRIAVSDERPDFGMMVFPDGSWRDISLVKAQGASGSLKGRPLKGLTKEELETVLKGEIRAAEAARKGEIENLVNSIFADKKLVGDAAAAPKDGAERKAGEAVREAVREAAMRILKAKWAIERMNMSGYIERYQANVRGGKNSVDISEKIILTGLRLPPGFKAAAMADPGRLLRLAGIAKENWPYARFIVPVVTKISVISGSVEVRDRDTGETLSILSAANGEVAYERRIQVERAKGEAGKTEIKVVEGDTVTVYYPDTGREVTVKPGQAFVVSGPETGRGTETRYPLPPSRASDAGKAAGEMKGALDIKYPGHISAVNPIPAGQSQEERLEIIFARNGPVALPISLKLPMDAVRQSVGRHINQFLSIKAEVVAYIMTHSQENHDLNSGGELDLASSAIAQALQSIRMQNGGLKNGRIKELVNNGNAKELLKGEMKKFRVSEARMKMILEGELSAVLLIGDNHTYRQRLAMTGAELPSFAAEEVAVAAERRMPQNYAIAGEAAVIIMAEANRDAKTFMTAPAREEEIDPDKGIDRRVEGFLEKRHAVQVSHYKIGSGDDWRKDVLLPAITATLPQFIAAVTASGGLTTRWAIRVLSPEDKEYVTGIIREGLRADKSTHDKYGNVVESAVSLALSKVRFIIINADNAPRMNPVMDMFLDFGSMELDRYGKEYRGEPSYSFKEKVARLLSVSTTNFDYVDGNTIEKVIKDIFEGSLILRIRAVDWEGLKDWKDAQDALAVSA